MSKRTAFNSILGGCLLLSAGSQVVHAQMPMDPPPAQAERSSPEQELKRLTKTLKLTDEQRVQILPILRERSEAMNKLFGDREIPMHDRFPKILEIIDRSNAKIRATLLEPQQKKFDKIVAEEKTRRESGPDDGPPLGDMPPPPPQ